PSFVLCRCAMGPRVSHSPENARGVQVKPRRPLFKLGEVSVSLDYKLALAAVEHDHIAGQRPYPAALLDARRELLVEQIAARRRQQHAVAVVALAPAALKHGNRPLQIAALGAKTLRAKIVGHALLLQRL